MTPEQVWALDDDTYAAFARYMNDELREREKAARRKAR
jgi:hypothetical protein